MGFLVSSGGGFMRTGGGFPEQEAAILASEQEGSTPGADPGFVLWSTASMTATSKAALATSTSLPVTFAAHNPTAASSNMIFGTVHFAKGECPTGDRAVIQQGGSTIAYQQSQNLDVYYDDGSLRQATIIGLLDTGMSSGGSQNLSLTTTAGAAYPAAPLTAQQVVNTLRTSDDYHVHVRFRDADANNAGVWEGSRNRALGGARASSSTGWGASPKRGWTVLSEGPVATLIQWWETLKDKDDTSLSHNWVTVHGWTIYWHATGLVGDKMLTMNSAFWGAVGTVGNSSIKPLHFGAEVRRGTNTIRHICEGSGAGCATETSISAPAWKQIDYATENSKRFNIDTSGGEGFIGLPSPTGADAFNVIEAVGGNAVAVFSRDSGITGIVNVTGGSTLTVGTHRDKVARATTAGDITLPASPTTGDRYHIWADAGVTTHVNGTGVLPSEDDIPDGDCYTFEWNGTAWQKDYSMRMYDKYSTIYVVPAGEIRAFSSLYGGYPTWGPCNGINGMISMEGAECGFDYTDGVHRRPFFQFSLQRRTYTGQFPNLNLANESAFDTYGISDVGYSPDERIGLDIAATSTGESAEIGPISDLSAAAIVRDYDHARITTLKAALRWLARNNCAVFDESTGFIRGRWTADVGFLSCGGPSNEWDITRGFTYEGANKPIRPASSAEPQGYRCSGFLPDYEGDPIGTSHSASFHDSYALGGDPMELFILQHHSQAVLFAYGGQVRPLANGTRYDAAGYRWPVAVGDNQAREQAWLLRDVSRTMMLCPNYFEGGVNPIKTLLSSQVEEALDYYIARESYCSGLSTDDLYISRWGHVGPRPFTRYGTHLGDVVWQSTYFHTVIAMLVGHNDLHKTKFTSVWNALGAKMEVDQFVDSGICIWAAITYYGILTTTGGALPTAGSGSHWVANHQVILDAEQGGTCPASNVSGQDYYVVHQAAQAMAHRAGLAGSGSNTAQAAYTANVNRQAAQPYAIPYKEWDWLAGDQ